jgi:hypothetical protein
MVDMFKLGMGKIYLSDLKIIFFYVPGVLTIELHPPKAKIFLRPTNNFDPNVLTTFTFNMRKNTLVFLRQFSYGVRTFKNTGRWYPALSD